MNTAPRITPEQHYRLQYLESEAERQELAALLIKRQHALRRFGVIGVDAIRATIPQLHAALAALDTVATARDVCVERLRLGSEGWAHDA